MRRHAHAYSRRREGRDLHLRAVRRVGSRAENFRLGSSREPYAVAATAIGRQRRSNWYHPLAFGTEPDDDEDDLATYYLNGAQIGEDAYEDAFVVAREAWLDASGQSQDEGEDEGEGGDEEEDAGEEGGDEEEDEAEDQEEADEEEGDAEEGDEEEDSEEGDEDADADEDRRRLQAAAGYSVTLTVTDDAWEGDRRLQANGDLFFMCNVHNYMAGRIKVYENGAPLNPEDTPALLKEPDVVSEYDQSCGTVGVGDYTRASGKCPYDSFICTEGDETPEQLLFGECMQLPVWKSMFDLHAIGATSARWRVALRVPRRSVVAEKRVCEHRYALDCHMNYHMKSILANSDPIVTFIHQMIPHHQNAVNMAKALLKTNTLDTSDEVDREMENMMWAIICVWKSTGASGAPDNSSLSHFSAMTRPCWLRRAVRNRHRHAIEQASHRWRGGRRERAVKFDFHTGHHQRPELPDPPDAGLPRGEELRRVGPLRVNAVAGAHLRADAAPDALTDRVSGQPDVSACARAHARPRGRNDPARRPRRRRDPAGRLVVVVGQLRHDHDPSLGQHHRDDLRCWCCFDCRGVRRGAPERPGGRQGPGAGPRRRRDRQGLAHCFYCLMLLRVDRSSEAARSFNLAGCIFRA